MHALAPAHILNLAQYIPGRPIKETQAEFGLEKVVKLASNENPWGPSPHAIEAIKRELYDGALYPISGRIELKEKICRFLQLEESHQRRIVLGNGANELITLLVRAFLGENEKILNAWPSFIVYRLCAQAHGRLERTVMLTPDLDYDLPALLVAANEEADALKMIFIANPNNPTGKYISKKNLDEFIAKLPPHIIVVVDEAYADFVDEDDYKSCIDWVFKRPRTVVVRTFSKIFGLAGFRIGYAVCDEEIADILHRIRDPFNVNCTALVAASAALDDFGHIKKCRENNSQERVLVTHEVQRLGLKVTPSAANFVLMHLQDKTKSMASIVNNLMRHGVIVRPVANYGLPNAARVTIGTPSENQLFLRALAEVIKNTELLSL